MKYSEFKREIEKLGYRVDNYPDNIYVETSGVGTIFSVSKNGTYAIDTNCYGFESLRNHEKMELAELAIQLAKTPLDEREDEKRYRLRLPFIKTHGYLNLDEINGVYELSGEKQVNNYQTIFAESEVEELKQNYNLDSFVMEEVKEDE